MGLCVMQLDWARVWWLKVLGCGLDREVQGEWGLSLCVLGLSEVWFGLKGFMFVFGFRLNGLAKNV